MHDIGCDNLLLLIPMAILGLLVAIVLLPVALVVAFIEAWR